MRIEMTVAITKPGGGLEFVCKEVNLPFTPNIGMDIWCTAWTSSRKIKNVTLNFDQDYEVESLILDMGIVETKNKEEQSTHIKIHQSHGWALQGE